MATLTLTIPNTVANRAFDAIAAGFGYTGFVNGVAQTKAEFFKAWVIKQIMDGIKAQEANVAAAAASSTAIADANTNIVIT